MTQARHLHPAPKLQHYLRCAAGQNGAALDLLVRTRRDANATKRFFKGLLKGVQYVPQVTMTDKLKSYGVAQRQLLPASTTDKAAI